jgi:hypothetical protein
MEAKSNIPLVIHVCKWENKRLGDEARFDFDDFVANFNPINSIFNSFFTQDDFSIFHIGSLAKSFASIIFKFLKDNPRILNVTILSDSAHFQILYCVFQRNFHLVSSCSCMQSSTMYHDKAFFTGSLGLEICQTDFSNLAEKFIFDNHSIPLPKDISSIWENSFIHPPDIIEEGENTNVDVDEDQFKIKRKTPRGKRGKGGGKSRFS